MTERLPGLLGEIADVAGMAAALKLARERGGTEMTFSGRPGSVLALIVGDEAAARIADRFGPQKYVIPMANVRGRGARQAAVARMMADKATASQAARAHEVHERTARRIRSKLKTGNGPLFDD